MRRLRPTGTALRAVAVAAVVGAGSVGLLVLVRPSAPTVTWAPAQVRALSPQVLTSLPWSARAPVQPSVQPGDGGYDIRGFSASNSAQRLSASFAPTGVTVAAGALHVHMALLGYGRGDALTRAPAVWPRVRANRATYPSAGISAWYANGPLGLEQGFDVPASPVGGSGPLALSLSLSGDVHARMRGRGLVLDGPGGSLLYRGLRAVDATGRRLRSWMALRRGSLLIEVDDRRATYPLHIDPYIENAELTIPNGNEESLLGESVAISGQTMVAGAPGQEVNSNVGQGAAFVFTKTAAGWTESTELVASNGAEGDNLGASVAISGQTVVVGAPGNDAAYVFTDGASGWAQTTELTVTAHGVGLGRSVAISGSAIAAGAPGREVHSAADQGEVYVFTDGASGWTQSTELFASGGLGVEEELGRAVAISGSTVVAGAPGREVGLNHRQGAVYVFGEGPSGWQDAGQSAELTASDGDEDDDLGESVAISGQTIAAGAPSRKVGHNLRQGAAYVFSVPSSGTKSANQSAELTASDGGEGDYLGQAVAVAGSTVVAGTPYQNVGANKRQGAAYVFAMPAAGWASAAQSAELTGAGDTEGESLGVAVAVSGSTVVAGADQYKVGSILPGAVEVFELPPPTIAIVSPANHATYTQGQSVPAAYSCAASAPATLTACAGLLPSGAPVDTATLGTHTFTVNATDSDGATTSQSVTYTVVAPPTPTITALKQSHSAWREGSKLAQVSARKAPRKTKKAPPLGTTFSFSLNEQATVHFSFTGLAGGRKVRGRCVAQTKKNRRARACKRTVTVGTLTFAGHSATNKVVFDGRISRSQKLKPSHYTLIVTATNAQGRTSKPQQLSFTIVK